MRDTQPSLQRRIYLMSCVLVALCIFATLVGLWGQGSLLQSFKTYENAEQTLAEFASLDRDIERLKSRTNNYLNSGADSQLNAALAIQIELVKRIDELRSQESASDLSETLDEMKDSLTIFQTQLKRAANERSLRRALVIEDLPAQQLKVRNELIRLGKLLQSAEDPSSELNNLLFESQTAHHTASESLQRYFIDPDSEAFDLALTSIGQCRSSVKEVCETLDTPESKSLQTNLDKQLAEYRRLGSRAFQATRGYMYYIDVVMAGELSEFAYYSNHLKELIESRREESRITRQKSANRARFLGTLASLVAVALAIFMASRLSYSIVAPISKITEVFRQLGQGVTVETIPALDRHDEIGRMARAAKVFNDKNRETNELLERSQQLSDELAEKANALEQTNQELDNFAYVASHDLKSPLRGISHLANWIDEDCGELLPPTSKAHLQQMQERVSRMNLLLDELLDYSRAGRISPKPETIDIEMLVTETASIIDRPEDFEILVTTPTFTFATYAAPLKQVLLNLLTNSVKYKSEDEDGRVEIFAEARGDRVFFSVKDNGRGIDPAFHEKVFKMYQRLATDVEGSGMGLAIVRKQVEILGGQISLISNEGEGAEFQFTWPIIDSTSDSSPSNQTIVATN